MGPPVHPIGRHRGVPDLDHAAAGIDGDIKMLLKAWGFGTAFVKLFSSSSKLFQAPSSSSTDPSAAVSWPAALAWLSWLRTWLRTWLVSPPGHNEALSSRRGFARQGRPGRAAERQRRLQRGHAGVRRLPACRQ